MTATFLAPPVFIYFVALGGGAGWGGGGGGLLFVAVTPPNLICNGYLPVGVFTIANGENKSVFAVFII